VGTALEHGLRGGESAIDEAQWADWLEGCEQLGRSLSGTADVVVLHDAAALGLAAGLELPVVWRCHLDASRAEDDALRRALSLSERCGLVLVPDDSFANDFGATVVAAAPGIDPFAARNLELEARLPGRLVRPLGVDLERPFCLQVLELDRWDDPHSVIDAVRLAREEEPELQLVLAALLESGDAQGWQAAKEVSDYALGAEGVRLVTSYEGLGGLEVGALELLARVVVEQSLGDSFDLAPCEALWKRTPVVGAARRALPLVVRDGVDGFLCETTEQIGARLVELVREPGLAAELGRAGRERVRERFLVTAAVERELRALGDSLAAR
jgi:trehalose synthase